MRMNREAFGLVISEISRTGDVTDTELVLTDTTPDPVKTHVNRLRHFGGDSGVGKADSRGLAGLHVPHNTGLVHRGRQNM